MLFNNLILSSKYLPYFVLETLLMSTPPSNLPFDQGITDEELEAELRHYESDAPGAVPLASPPRPTAPTSTATPSAASISAPAINPLTPSVKREPVDMFSNLDQSPKRPPAPTSLADLPARSSSSALKYVLIFGVVSLVLVGGGFAFWYFAIKRPANELAKLQANVVIPPPVPVSPTVVPNSATTDTLRMDDVPFPVDPTLPSAAVSDPASDLPIDLPPPVVTPPPGAAIPPPESVTPTASVPPTSSTDTDNDGLSDQREVEIGTDPRTADTDGDAIHDGDEVLKYGTNPVDRDTDKDSYLDGGEIQNGYNPRGAGKCTKPDCAI